MRYVEVNGKRLSAIGVGTWQFGSREWGYGEDYAGSTAAAIVHRALDLGVNLIDTAEIYGFGASERIVGAAIEGRRDEAFVATKLFPVLPVGPVAEWRAVESAGRLGVRCLDLYQVHWPNPFFSRQPAMAAMARLQQVGLVDQVGVSNYRLVQWMLAERKLGGPVLSNQVQYSLAARKPDAELVPWAQANDRLIIAYSPLAQGLLGGRYDVDHPPPPGVRSNNPLFLPDNLERAAGLLQALREIACRPRGHARPRWRWPGSSADPNVVAIPGASSVSQLEANVAAADLELTDDDDARLTDESDRFTPLRGPAALPAMLLARQEARRAERRSRARRARRDRERGLRRGRLRGGVELVEGRDGGVEHAGRAAGHGHRRHGLVDDHVGEARNASAAGPFAQGDRLAGVTAGGHRAFDGDADRAAGPRRRGPASRRRPCRTGRSPRRGRSGSCVMFSITPDDAQVALAGHGRGADGDLLGAHGRGGHDDHLGAGQHAGQAHLHVAGARAACRSAGSRGRPRPRPRGSAARPG